MKSVREFLREIETINELPTLEELFEKGTTRELCECADDVYEEILNLNEEFTIKDGTKLCIEYKEGHLNCDNNEGRYYNVVGTKFAICMTCGEILIDKVDKRNLVLRDFKDEKKVKEMLLIDFKGEYITYYDIQECINYIDCCVENKLFSIEISDIAVKNYYKNQCEKYLKKYKDILKNNIQTR